MNLLTGSTWENFNRKKVFKNQNISVYTFQNKITVFYTSVFKKYFQGSKFSS